MRGTRAMVAVVTVVLASAVLAGCGYSGAKDLPLPGSIRGSDTYQVSLKLDDATNLVVKESCRSNDTIIGSVESIELDKNLKARVVCRIKNSVQLPSNATATMRETSLLGERFVSIDTPPGVEPQGRMAPGSTLPTSSTRVDPNVEMVLGALSQVLNGGSLGSVETISRELDVALRGSDVGSTVDSLDHVTGKLNAHRTQITASLDSLDRLMAELAKQREVIAEALDSIPGGLEALDRQRHRIIAVLRQLRNLSNVAVPLIHDTRKNTVTDLTHLQPVLAQVSKAGDELALTLERLTTFPFTPNSWDVIKGDYAGLYGTIELDIDSLNEVLGKSAVPAAPASAAKPVGAAHAGTGTGPAAPGSGGLLPELPLVPGVPGLLGHGSGTGKSTLGGLLGGLLGDAS
jgi:phospholipid/cholesterol/gamma-HCH transport system substrate-binding protein